MKENILKLTSFIIATEMEPFYKAQLEIDFERVDFYMFDNRRIIDSFQVETERDIKTATNLIKAYAK